MIFMIFRSSYYTISRIWSQRTLQIHQWPNEIPIPCGGRLQIHPTMPAGDADKRSLRQYLSGFTGSEEQWTKRNPLLLVYLEDFFVFFGDKILAFFCYGVSITKDYDNDDVSCLITRTIAVARVFDQCFLETMLQRGFWVQSLIQYCVTIAWSWDSGLEHTTTTV